MREILFRGKRKDTGEWIYGDFVGGDMICDNLEDTENATGTYYGQTPYVGFTNVVRETVGQFTGMADKNSKKIFEGDILIHAKKYRYKVFWCNDRKGFYVRGIDFSDYDYIGNFYTHTIEVIGNIHDNPELLEVN